MRFLLAAILILICAAGANAASVQLTVWRAWPSEGNVLPKFGSIYLEIGYDSDVPIRLQTKAFSDGKLASKGQMMNATVVYPSGHGTGLVWVGFHEPATIDEIVITAYDENFRELTRLFFARHAQWSARPATRSTELPQWIGTEIANDRAIAEKYAADHPPKAQPFAWMATIIAFLSVPGYFILQPYALAKLQGRWRLAAFAPLVLMIPACAHAMWALSQESNLWPIVFMLFAPFGFFYLAGLLAIERNS